MVLFTFNYLGDNPAIYITNNSITVKELREKFPDSNYLASYNLDASAYEVPLNIMLYDEKRELNLLKINSELEAENRRLHAEIIDLKERTNTPSPISPIYDEGDSDSIDSGGDMEGIKETTEPIEVDYSEILKEGTENAV